MKNHLEKEKSPYLLQHKNNPVWWYPWGSEAFEAAKKEDKPIFLSIGYSTCHWCHVMEKDSFEKQEVAEILNKSFISIKVDREERPDVDALYMNAVQAMTGSGGWPMTTLLTSEGKPFWGGTFVPHTPFISLLTRAAELWANDRNELLEGGSKLAAHLQEHADLPRHDFKGPSETSLLGFFHQFKDRFDSKNGGFSGFPKFPQALSLMCLLRIYRRTGNKAPLEMVEKSLQEMRRGGIYDHIGGGFHRYSVDAQWRIPHFEKMLYDNALLASVYLEAFQVTKNGEYSRTAGEILNYILRDMTHSDGGFFSAEDADSENIEGKFYAWPLKELEQILSVQELTALKPIFNFNHDGNFQVHTTGDEVTSKKNGPPALVGNVFYISSNDDLPSADNEIIKAGIEKLFQTRAGRVRPHLDDKIITSWNGLMISALSQGARTLGEKKFLAAAQKAGNFILAQLSNKEGELFRTYREGESRNRATAEDYSFLIEGLLNLYETDFNSNWLGSAIALQNHQLRLFWDIGNGAFFDNDGTDPHLFSRLKSYEDGVVPSANSVGALNLLKLYELTAETPFKEKALDILKTAAFYIENHPQAVPKLLQSLDRLTDQTYQVAMTGNLAEPEIQKFLKELRTGFYPQVTLAYSDDLPSSLPFSVPLLKDRSSVPGQATFFVCQNQSCKLPVTEATKALASVQKLNHYEIL